MSISLKMEDDDPIGFLNLNKPAAMTSHAVVARVRRSLGIKKLGHAGTLDPLATGVLVLCVGGATRLSEYVMESVKRYRALLRLGVTTDTYDAEGTVVRQRDPSRVTRNQIERALSQFIGPIEQVPPMYSAVKHNGRKLYELARAGKTVERRPRPVTIYELEVTHYVSPFLTLEVVCSPGTYVRSLAHDLGQALKVGASLAGLTRTASGMFTLENAVSLETLLSSENWREYLIAPAQALEAWQSVILDDDALRAVRQGRAIVRQADQAADLAPLLAMAYDGEGELVAVLRAAGDVWKPQKVFST